MTPEQQKKATFGRFETAEAASANDQAFHGFIDTLAAAFPQHRLTYGYIGNLTRHGDDRGYYVFTRYLSKELRTSVSYCLGSFGHSILTEDLKRKIQEWVAGLDEKVKKGVIEHP